MGEVIGSYSLEELNRIRLPGNVPPLLFWAVPVGRWSQNAHDRFWREFTQGHGDCRKYGLLLQKGGRENGGRVSHLIPAGQRWEGVDDDSDSQRILVLSGSFPQPGWGVLLDCPDFPRFEGMIGEVLTEIAPGPGSLESFDSALDGFRELSGLQRPAEFDLDNAAIIRLGDEVRAIEEALSWCSEIAVDSVADWEPVIQSFNQSLSEDIRTKARFADIVRELRTITSVLRVDRPTFNSDIVPAVEKVRETPQQERGRVFKELGILSQIVSPCSQLDVEPKAIYDWAESSLPAVKRDFLAEVDTAGFRERLIKKRTELETLKWELENAAKGARSVYDEANLRYRSHALSAFSIQSQLGPKFLISLEKAARRSRTRLTSVHWDPPRMIGWKIQGIGIVLEDLNAAARELAEVPPAAENVEVDGSYFTDYVHHIVVSKGGSARKVTRTLVKELVKHSAAASLIRSFGGKVADSQDRESRINELLIALGWIDDAEIQRTPLAGCVVDNGGVPQLRDGYGSNDVRKIAESFCKDLLDVLVNEAGLRKQEIWRNIKSLAPNYISKSHCKSWSQDIDKLTLGGASILIPVFLRLNQKDVDPLITVLEPLGKELNADSHDPPRTPDPAKIARLV